MINDLRSSALSMAFFRIMSEQGSPYSRLETVVSCGGNEYRPLQVIREDVGMDFRGNYMDDHSIVLSFGLGTFQSKIEPYQDDIKITVLYQPLDEQTATLPVSIETKTYKAYIGDQIPTGPEVSNNPIMQDSGVADLAKIVHVRFMLEEIAVDHLRKMSLGTIARKTPPYAVVQTLMNRACQSLRLADEDKILGMEFVEPSNKEIRNHVVIPDGTPLLDIPDYIQNEQGGIYSTALGFYIKGRYLYFWPLYAINRQSSASRLLQIYLSPSKQGAIIDRTWAEEGRSLKVISSGGVDVHDDSLGELNTKGNAVRFTDSRKLLGDFASIEGNRMVFNRGTNNSEFSTVVIGDGSHMAKVADAPTSNIFLESSKLSKRAGIFVTTLWRRSDPQKITPGMAVEISYDYSDQIRVIEGTLVGAFSSRVLVGKGLIANQYITNTSLTVFVDRNDPDFIKYLESVGSRNSIEQSTL